jgi:hypothetical protein
VSAEIIVTRASSAWRDRLRAYKLVVDGTSLASVSQGQTEAVSVAPGRHRVWMKIDWCRSQIVECDLSEGDTARFDCRTGGPFVLALLYVTVWRSRYIDLQLRSIDPASSHLPL